MATEPAPAWHVVYLEVVPPEVLDIVRSRLPAGFHLQAVSDHGDAAVREALRDADFVLVATRPLPRELIAQAPRLRLIQHQGVGYENIDIAAAHAAGVPVALCPEGTTTGVAEHTILLILAVYKQLLLADRSVRQGEWLQFGLRANSFELAGKRLGLVGFGRIGRAVARRARAFDAEVCYYDLVRAPRKVERDLRVSFLSLEELLAGSDIISLHVPSTPETRHLINEETLALMRRQSILINTARGALVDQAALVRALRDGRLAGAGLDVFEEEPPRPDDPLLSLSNVVLTPHIAAGTRDALMAKMEAAFANMLRVTRGEEPLHLVRGASRAQ